ncbi:LmeA family phospholipid-binding protein [Streptomyces sp. 7R007]
MIRSALRRHRALTLTAAALALTLLFAGAAELAARALLHSRLAAAVGRALGKDGDVRVDITGGPALLDLYERHLDAVTVTGDHAVLGPVPDVSVRARLDDVRLSGHRSGTVAHTHADVEVPTGSLRDMTSGAGGRLRVSAVRADATSGTLTLDLDGGLGRATLKPRLKDGRVALDLQSADVLGAPAPAALVDRIRGRLAQRADVAYPLGLKATAVDVTDEGLSITLDGGRTRLPARSVP